MDEILELRGKLLLDDHTGLLQICLLKKKKKESSKFGTLKKFGFWIQILIFWLNSSYRKYKAANHRTA